MAKHVTSLPASADLPSPTGLEEGSALIRGGVLHVIQGAKWVEVSSSGGGGASGGEGSGLPPLTWRGVFDVWSPYPAGSVVADTTGVYVATVDVEPGLGQLSVAANRAYLLRMSDPKLGPGGVAFKSSEVLPVDTLNAAMRFQVRVPTDLEGVMLSYAASTANTRAGAVGISSTDPASGDIAWMGVKEAISDEGMGTGRPKYTATFFDGSSSTSLNPGVDYWLVFTGLAPALGVMKASDVGTPLVTLPSSDIIPDASGLRTGPQYNQAPAAPLFPVVSFIRSQGGRSPLRTWMPLSLKPATPIGSSALQGSVVQFASPDGTPWKMSVSDAGQVTAARFPVPANNLLAGATAIAPGSTASLTTLGSTKADSKANSSRPSVWAKVAATATNELLVRVTSERYFNVTVWASPEATPAIGTLTRLAGATYMTSGVGQLTITHPRPGAVFYLEVSPTSDADNVGVVGVSVAIKSATIS